MNAGLWILQGLLAAIFLFAGFTKLILPVEVLMSMGSPNQIVLPGWFIKFIGAAEVLGAIGLILPRLLHIRPRLTPLAATGLVFIMIGATLLTFAADGFAPALFTILPINPRSIEALARSKDQLGFYTLRSARYKQDRFAPLGSRRKSRGYGSGCPENAHDGTAPAVITTSWTCCEGRWLHLVPPGLAWRFEVCRFPRNIGP